MKNLFFSAMLALVAVGGALTGKAAGVYFDKDSNPIDCTSGSVLCSQSIPPQTLWTQPDQQGTSIQSTDLDETNLRDF